MQIRARLIGALCAAVVAGALIAVGTQPPGPGIDPDALAYVGAARSLATNGVYRVPTAGWAAADSTSPLEHFPPAFSTAMAIPILAGVGPIPAGRLVVVVAGALTAAAIFAMVAAAAGMGWATLAVIIVFATPAVLCQYLSLLSEPLYIVFLLASVTTLASLHEQMARVPSPVARPRLSTIIMFALSAAAIVMTRFAGAPIVALGALFALIWGARWWERLRTAIIVALPTVIVMFLWVTQGAHGAKNIREFRINRGLSTTVLAALGTVRDAIIPGTGGFVWRTVAAVAGALVLLLVLWHAWRNPVSARARALLLSLGWVMTACTAMLIVSRVIADPGIPGDERILSPLILLGELAVVLGLASLWRRLTRERRTAAAAIVLAWVAPSASLCQNRIGDRLELGSDLGSIEWRDSPLMAWVRTNGSGHTLYTNWPAAVYFQAGRNAHTLPQATDALTLHRFRDRLVRQHGLVIAFTTPSQDYAFPDSVAVRLRLQVVARLADGIVWAVPDTIVPAASVGRVSAAHASPLKNDDSRPRKYAAGP